MKNLLAVILAVLAWGGFPYPVFSAPKDDSSGVKKLSSAMKEVQGEIVWKSKNKLSVLYRSDDRSEQEILFLIDTPVRVVHRASLDEIQIGDTIRVVYEEFVQAEAGRQRTRTRPVEITFIRRGTKTLPRAQESVPAPESSVIISE